jgi:hypothetical protein
LRHPFFNDRSAAYPEFTFQIDSVPAKLKDALTENQCVEWATLLEKQEEMPRAKDYLSRSQQSECVKGEKLTPRMRAILVDWLAEVSYSWCMRAERRALHTAVQCLDRFLSQTTVPKARLQLIGATCYALAAKLEEAEVISPGGYAHISDFAFKEEDMRDCEVEVAHALGCHFAYAATPDFEPLLATAMGLLPNGPAPLDAEVSNVILLAQLLTDHMLLGFHVDDKSWAPSVVTSAAFVVASLTLANPVPPVALCNADEEAMCQCVRDIVSAYHQAIEWELRNLNNNSKYAAVSGLEIPDAEFICTKISEAYDALV